MNDEAIDIKAIRAHPMPGWVAIIPSKVDGVIRQEVTEAAIDKHKDRLERRLESEQGFQIIDLQSLLTGSRPKQEKVELTRREVKSALEEVYRAFESGLVVEIGKLPPGYDLEDSDGNPMEPGSKAYYQEGGELQIGELSFIRIIDIICWS